MNFVHLRASMLFVAVLIGVQAVCTAMELPPAKGKEAEKTAATASPAAVPNAGAAASAPEKKDPPKKPEITVKPYGYVKLDLAWDDSRTSTGNFARWVEDESVNADDDEFNATINQTRLGLDASCDAAEGVKVSAKIEADLYGNGAAENKSEFMLRHAYVAVDLTKIDLQVLAGQASDLISPLNPSTVNYTVLWWNGNVGYRRPQLRLTKGFDTGGEKILVAAALLRNIGHDNGAWDPGDTGEDAGFGALQARIAVTREVFPKESMILGISGHWAQESYDSNAAGLPSTWVTGWALSFEIRVPFQPWLSLQAEAWIGENVDQLLGGIGQGVTAGLAPIRSAGGWAALTIKVPDFPAGKLAFNAGAGLDDPDNDKLGAGARARNFSWFANAWWEPVHNFQVALELTRLETQYKDREQAEATRIQLALQFAF